MDYRDKSFWLESLNITPNPELQSEDTAEVVVVGGGFTGLSTAYHIKQMKPGWKVILLESEVCGFGASGRNGGFSMTLFGFTKQITRLRFGDRKAISAHRYMEEAVDYLNEFAGGLDCDHERTGYLLVATSKGQEKRLEHDFRLAEKWGLGGIERWPTSKLRSEFATDVYRLGWFEPRCAILNPARLAREMKRTAEDKGTLVYENTPVTGFERSRNGFLVRTPKGRVRSEYLVLATNAYSGCFPSMRKLQQPVFTHISLTDKLSDAAIRSIGWQSRVGVEDAKNLIHYYRLTRDNRILMGGGDVTVTYGQGLDRDLNRRVATHLERHIVEVFPQLKGTRVSHHWGGPVSITLDMAPVIGYLGNDNKAIFSVGCTGHGVSMTVLNGKTIAELICGIKSERTEMFFVGRRVFPWPPEPIRFAASHIIRSWLKFEDRLL